MNLPLFLTAEAESELLEAALWYEQRSTGRGMDFVSRVREALLQIRANPTLFAVLQGSIRRAPVRQFPYGVFYRCSVDRIEVIAVFHSSRDPAVWQGRT